MDSNSPTPSRCAAFEILRDVIGLAGDPATLLHNASRMNLSDSDSALMTEITYGVLRWMKRLDFVVARHSSRKLNSISAVPLLALRIGIYQLEFLTKVPPRAAIDESVRLTRHYGSERAVPFVNAILRSISRKTVKIPLPKKNESIENYLTVTQSHPKWIVQRYISRLGPAGAESLCRFQNTKPTTDLRVSRTLSLEQAQTELARVGIDTTPIIHIPEALRVTQGQVLRTALYQRGLVRIQDAGAQLVANLVAPPSNDKIILDMCSAPGGKCIAIADQYPDCRILALDIRHRRSRLTMQLTKSASIDSIWILTSDSTKLPVNTSFSRILLDAPCSNLGTLRRNPDIKWRANEKNLQTYAANQLALLRVASQALCPGGQLVYSTCSSEPEENESVIDYFLTTHPKFHIVPIRNPHFRTPEGYLKTNPARDLVDGHFAAVLTRH